MKKYTWFLFALLSLAFVFSFNINTSSAGTTCSMGYVALRLGSRGAEVQCLQMNLGITADGKFGPMTRNAVIAFQVNHSLTPDGVFGARSRNTWNSGGSAISLVTIPLVLSVGETATWQVRINSTYTMARSSWYVIWGDEQVPPLPTSFVYVGPNTTSGADDAAKFYHAYSSPGVYHPTFYIISEYGTKDQTTTIVNVNNGVDITAPHINAVAPSTISVGSSVNITGKWLISMKDGGDTSIISNMVLWLKNSQGVAVVLPFTKASYTSPNAPLSATIPSTLCKYILFQGTCPENSWLQITPGVYTLYVQQDTHVGMETTNSNSVSLTITSSAQPTITVLSPKTGDNLVAGSTNLVTWRSTNLTSLDYVNIWLIDNANSSPNYQHYSQELVHATVNDGSQSVTIPAQLSGSFELRVQLTNGRDNSGSSFVTITQ